MRVRASVLLCGSLLLAGLPLAGCHSKYIQATITNHSDATLHVVQVDYPSASFGTQELAAGASFHYRFKLLGTGPLKVTFTDARRQDHTQAGPVMHEGEEGTLGIEFSSQEHAKFHVSVHP